VNARASSCSASNVGITAAAAPAMNAAANTVNDFGR
jgi:hypothetical protein